MNKIYRCKILDLERKAFELTGLIGVGQSSQESFLGSRFFWIRNMYLTGDFLGLNTEILKLDFLFKHLKELYDFHPVAYKRARKLIVKAKKSEQYFGARMEIYTAASLIRKGVDFSCGESPDYTILGGCGIGIECGSTHFSGVGVDIVKKVSLSVINKCKKPYVNKNTLLMMDITNPLMHGLSYDDPELLSKIRESIYSEINKKGYGSVVLLSYAFDESATKIIASMIRVDSECINENLFHFMENNYPVSVYSEKPYYYPDQA